MVRGMYMYMCMHAIMCVNPPLKYAFMYTFTCHNTARAIHLHNVNILE